MTRRSIARRRVSWKREPARVTPFGSRDSPTEASWSIFILRVKLRSTWRIIAVSSRRRVINCGSCRADCRTPICRPSCPSSRIFRRLIIRKKRPVGGRRTSWWGDARRTVSGKQVQPQKNRHRPRWRRKWRENAWQPTAQPVSRSTVFSLQKTIVQFFFSFFVQVFSSKYSLSTSSDSTWLDIFFEFSFKYSIRSFLHSWDFTRPFFPNISNWIRSNLVFFPESINFQASNQ